MITQNDTLKQNPATCRHLVIILGDQLNLDNVALEGFDTALDHILMVEAAQECTHVWSHKARIALFLSAMRHHAEALKALNYPLTYLDLASHTFTTLKAAWLHYVNLLKPQKIIVCEAGDYRVEQDLIALSSETNTPIAIRDDAHFMCSRAEFSAWAAGGKQLRMEFFYRTMRKKYNVLMQGDQPEGGAWNYDAENRNAFSKAGPQNVPAEPSLNIDSITQTVIDLVNDRFAGHPGSLAHFIWPVTRAQALTFLDDFVANKLAGFGDHQDAMWQAPASSLGFESASNPYLWHSLLSTSLNLKLLNPREVIEAAMKAYQASTRDNGVEKFNSFSPSNEKLNRSNPKNEKLNSFSQTHFSQAISLASVEGFIRQIIGWREFIRAMYWLDMPQMAVSNHYQHRRALPSWYWTANTHMNCQRQTVQQTLDYGYAHHIQRLMITGMFGVLAELNPREVEAWYLSVYVDAVEWVELPNVAGMALYANGGRFTSKPYVASGAYIKRMSNYCSGCQYKPEQKTGANACPVTVLYWHFLIKHYDVFSRNPRTALMTKNVDRLSEADVAEIKMSADKMLQNLDAL